MLRIGLDFDNTIVNYDAVLHRLAAERGLIEDSCSKDKREIRDRIRLLQNGEESWTRLQSVLYAHHAHEGEMNPGFAAFIAAIRSRGASIWVVSHKTRRAQYEPDGPDLHELALRWMTEHGFFGDGLGFRREDIFLEESRSFKVGRIRALECSHFVDDLPEVLLDPDFPAATRRLLYAPKGESRHEGLEPHRSWDSLAGRLAEEAA